MGGSVCFDHSELPEMLGRGVTGIHVCDRGPTCSMHEHGDPGEADNLPKLREGGPVTSLLFNPISKPAWTLASKVMPQAITPVAAAATIGDELLDGGD